MARAISLPVLVRIAEIRRELVLRFMERVQMVIDSEHRNKRAGELLVKYSKYEPMGRGEYPFSRPHTVKKM